jgi:hypothetical protein
MHEVSFAGVEGLGEAFPPVIAEHLDFINTAQQPSLRVLEGALP